MALWTPEEITTALWLDASDSSTITISTGVSEWRDKSGSVRHAVQTESVLQPLVATAALNGLDALTFDGVNDYLSVVDTSGLQFGTGDFAALAIVMFDNVSKGGASQNTVLSKNYTGFELNNYEGSVSGFVGGTSGSAAKTGLVSSQWVLISQMRMSGSHQVGLNATQGTAVTNNESASNIGTDLHIGIRAGGGTSLFLGGKLGEILIFPAGISSGDIAKTEGYLTWKWGLQDNLPSGHPYKDAAPTTGSQELIVSGSGGGVFGGLAGVIKATSIIAAGGAVVAGTAFIVSELQSLIVDGSGGCVAGGEATVDRTIASSVSYLAYGTFTTSPRLHIYKKEDDVYTALDTPDVVPTGDVLDCTFSANNTYLAVAHGTTPFVSVYKRNIDTFTKLSDPVTLPTGTGRGVSWSEDAAYLAVSHSVWPYLSIYKREGDTLTWLNSPLPGGGPPNISYSCAFSYDSVYLAVCQAITPWLAFWKRSGDDFTFIGTVDVATPGATQRVAFSHDGTHVAIGHSGSPYLSIYKRTGDVFNKLTDPLVGGLPTGQGLGVSYSSDDAYLAVSHQTTPFITIYSRSGDVYTKVTTPATLPPTISYDVAFSADDTHLAVAFDGSPYTIIYDRSGDTFTPITEGFFPGGILGSPHAVAYGEEVNSDIVINGDIQGFLPEIAAEVEVNNEIIYGNIVAPLPSIYSQIDIIRSTITAEYKAPAPVILATMEIPIYVWGDFVAPMPQIHGEQGMSCEFVAPMPQITSEVSNPALIYGNFVAPSPTISIHVEQYNIITAAYRAPLPKITGAFADLSFIYGDYHTPMPQVSGTAVNEIIINGSIVAPTPRITSELYIPEEFKIIKYRDHATTCPY